ncbi:Imm53 family immunity protein, partial [Actinoplanes derwentensis]
LRHHERMAGPEADFHYYEPDALTWLQGWYATQCDGDWEHEYGVSIETLQFHPCRFGSRCIRMAATRSST